MPQVLEELDNQAKLDILLNGCRFRITSDAIEETFHTRHYPADDFGPAFTVVYQQYTFSQEKRGTISKSSNSETLVVTGTVLHQIQQVTLPLAEIEILHS